MDNYKVQSGSLMRVYVRGGEEIKLSGVIGIIPEQDTVLTVKVPFFIKNSAQVTDFLKSVINAGGKVEVVKD